MDDIWGKKPAAPSAPTSAGSMDWPSKSNPGSGGGGTPAPSAVKQSSGGTSRDDYWANREARDLEKERVYREEDLPAIRRSTAYNVASTLAAAALQQGAISFGSTAKGKHLGMFLDAVDLIAEHVYARIQGEEIATASEPADDNEGGDNDGLE